MVAVSGNTGSAPLIGSEVIRDRASDAKSDADCVRFEIDRTPNGVKQRLNSMSYPYLCVTIIIITRREDLAQSLSAHGGCS